MIFVEIFLGCLEWEPLINLLAVYFHKLLKSSQKRTKERDLFYEKVWYWFYLLVLITYQCRHTVISLFKSYSSNKSSYAFHGDFAGFLNKETNVEASIFKTLIRKWIKHISAILIV